MIQKCVYHNNFLCDPNIDQSGTAGSKQKNYSFRIKLNSPWLFPNGWNGGVHGGAILTPNKAIVPVNADNVPVDGTTVMPGLRNGYAQYEQFARGCVIGTKVTISATPLQNSADNQPGVLYSVVHSQPSSGLSTASNIDDLQKLPFRKMTRLNGANATTSGFQVNNIAGARMTIRHSPKKFNSVYGSVKTNNNLWFQTKNSATGTGGPAVGKQVSEGDYLTVGIMPSLNTLDQQVTKCSIQMRVEQTILLTEPLENVTAGDGNFPLPRPANTQRSGRSYYNDFAQGARLAGAFIQSRNARQAANAMRRILS